METRSTSLGIFLEEKKNHNQIVCKTLSTNGPLLEFNKDDPGFEIYRHHDCYPNLVHHLSV